MPKHHNLGQHLKNDSPPPRLLVSVDVAAEMLSLGRTRIYELMSAGELPFVKVGASRRLRVTDLENYAASLTDERIAATA
jgi:excisionase family DNA binding protein